MDREETDANSQGLSPATAFALLGHEQRVAILRALLVECRRREEYPTSFSTLRARAGIDVSSQFSYHLDELTGHFVRRTDTGYELRYAGWEIVTSILSGTYNRRAAFGPSDIDGACPQCGKESLRASYREEWLSVCCSACDSRLIRYTFPPGGLESRSASEAVAAFDSHVRSHLALASDGICPACSGIVEVEVATDGDCVYKDRVAICVCQRCGNRILPQVGAFLVEDRRVERFFRRHDRDLSTIPIWELDFCVDTEPVTVTAADPWRCAVEIALDDETLTVTVDDALAVRSTEVHS